MDRLRDLSSARLFDIIEYQLEHFPQSASLAGHEDGKWRKYSTQEVIDTAHRVAAGLIAKGIQAGDRVGIISSTNRPEWNLIDLGVLQLGGVDVPIYPTITEKDFTYIINHSECRLVFVSDEDLYKKIQSIAEDCPTLEGVYMFDRAEGVPHWTDMLEPDVEKAKAIVAPYKEKVDHESLATLIYTSGTTGVPKGVMLSHKNLVSNVIASSERLPIEPGARSLSFLPLCHVFERMLIYLYAFKGSNVYYARSLETIGDDMRDVKPHIFTAVPRLLEKVYDRIIDKGEALDGMKRKLFFWAVSLAERFEYYGDNGPIYGMKLAIARKLIFSKWKEALGGEVQLAASGSAALSPRLCRIFNAAGIPIMEGYGLTETSPVISVNEIDNEGFMFGTTGRPIRDVQVRIAEDGEILCKGPNVMMGYYKNEEMTAEVIDSDGWFHTGDIGELVNGEYVKITDRKKEIFKTSGGKYIAPQIMENVFKQSRYIEQIMVTGENRKHPSALVVPNGEALEDFCEEHGMSSRNMENLLVDERIIDLFDSEIERLNTDFSQWEKVKKFRLIAEPWSIEGGELTPTLKLRRKQVKEKYGHLIEDMYQE